MPFLHEKLAIYVSRSVRAGGDTKTEKSRRTLELPDEVAETLREHRKRQATERLAAGEMWQDHNLVFCSPAGTELTPRTCGERSGSSPRRRRSVLKIKIGLPGADLRLSVSTIPR